MSLYCFSLHYPYNASQSDLNVSSHLFDIVKAGLDDERLLHLIAESNAYAVAHSPDGKDYAVTPGADGFADMTYWLALEGGSALGCIGLKRLAPDHGEIKSMHVGEAHRGKGAAGVLVRHLLAEARSKGMVRVSLETGTSDGYAMSRRFYAQMGFEPCPVFGEYLKDGVSYCMTRLV
ncbi:MAG: GNAT family N-acetyltransferase [Pseudomonadota bacterium]